jgi:glycosyltransferase involved in cell wall biosynthesis
MKKVLLTINNNRLSGIEKFTLLLAKYLDKDKFKVEIGIPTFGPYCKILEEHKIDYFIFDNKINGRYTLRGIWFIFKRILDQKYDVIHAQAGIAPCVIGKFSGTKLLIEHKHGLDFTKEQIENMSFLKLNYEKLKKYFVDLTFTGCEADKNTLIKRFNYKTENVKVLYNGLESKINSREKVLNKKFTIGTIGRLTYQKGQEYFIEMAKILTEKGYDFDYVIYGEGEKYNELNDQIKKYNLNEYVLLKGYTENISDTLNTLNVFVLPSRYEGIPYVIMEAMRESVPVIATNVGGISEIIKDNFNGILVSKENAEELVEEVLKLYLSNDFKEQLTNNAKRDFEEKFSIEKTINEVESVYSECN